MSTRIKEIIAMVVIALFCLVFYLRKVYGGEPIEFSGWLSLILIILLFLSLVWVLILTLQGKLIGRRVVFLYVGVALTLPLFMTLGQKINVSNEVQSIYDTVNELPSGAKVLVSFDYDPPTAPELQPMAETFLRLCFEKDLKVIIMALWPQGPQQANLALERVLEIPEIADKKLVYGRDYVNLGFQSGNEFVIQRMGTSFESMFPSDYTGTPYQELPLVKNVRNFSNIDYSFNLSAGFPGTVEWVQVAVDRYGVLLSSGSTAVQAPQIYPYLNAGQLNGILGGMNGAAEFEKVTGYEGKGTKYMLSQSFSHLVIIAFVIIGNIAFIISGRKSLLNK